MHEATWLGCKLVVKVIKSTGDTTKLWEEILILSELRHPHVVQLVGYCEAKGKSMILMERMCGDLRTLVDKKCRDGTPPFPQLVAVDIISQVAAGMAYLHDRGVFHGDLKASNVLVSHDCGPIEVKISDFGVSQCLQLTRDCETCLRKHGDVCPSCNLSVYIYIGILWKSWDNWLHGTGSITSYPRESLYKNQTTSLLFTCGGRDSILHSMIFQDLTSLTE